MLQLSLFAPPKRTPCQPSHGCIHFPDLLPSAIQQSMVRLTQNYCQSLWHRPKFEAHGRKMKMGVNVATMGPWWTLSGYEPAKVECPELIYQQAQLAIAAIEGMPALGEWEKVSAIAQWYDPYNNKKVKLGMHRDDSEHRDLLDAGSPVVSFSLGCSAHFLWGGASRSSSAVTVEVCSGDVVIFGLQSRKYYHGISKVFAETEPLHIQQRFGRLNITVRQGVLRVYEKPRKPTIVLAKFVMASAKLIVLLTTASNALTNLTINPQITVNIAMTSEQLKALTTTLEKAIAAVTELGFERWRIAAEQDPDYLEALEFDLLYPNFPSETPAFSSAAEPFLNVKIGRDIYLKDITGIWGEMGDRDACEAEIDKLRSALWQIYRKEKTAIGRCPMPALTIEENHAF